MGAVTAAEVRVWGTVQGVGFRPFIYTLAREHGLAGYVRNDSLGVQCLVVGGIAAVNSFTDAIRPRAPRLAVVDLVTVTPVDPPDPHPDDFTIIESQSLGERKAFLPVDTHACIDCLREMRDPEDRRYGYPFINCTNCGPRYSIIRDLPYDRPATSMAEFAMCANCRREYEDPSDRRYHAQPIACADCGPCLRGFVTVSQRIMDDVSALDGAAHFLEQDEIVAIKSVGGFHLAVNASSESAVSTLRKRKRRDWKPFAIMARSVEAAERIAQLSSSERAVLESPQRPILLARKSERIDEHIASSVAPRNPSVGIMLPSAPHHELLMGRLGLDYLVMTSGNIAGFPIAIQNASAREQLSTLAAYILDHNREIVNRLDDTVLRLTTAEGTEPYFTYLRRGRGYAPFYVQSVAVPTSPILASGSELKASAALSDGAIVYASQHVGDMKNDACNEAHLAATSRLADLYGIRPQVVVSDLHPAFVERTEHMYGSAQTVQHHHAHMAACLLDNGLPESQYLGIILDGTGYGSDGTMWGAEYLVGGYSSVNRVSALRAIPLIGGDAAVRRPSRIALALMLGLNEGDLTLRQRERVEKSLGLSEEELLVFSRMLERDINTFAVSSMGRLFDGVAALLGIAQTAEYEAQGPIELEGLLNREHKMADCYESFARHEGVDGLTRLDWGPTVRDTLVDAISGTSRVLVSRRFHSTVARSIANEAQRIAEEFGLPTVVLSGGVLLNEFLNVNIPMLLEGTGLTVYRHRRVPTNDGGIAIGQIAVQQARFEAQL